MNKEQKRQKRKMHIKKHMKASLGKLRLFVFKSNKYLYAGVADDVATKVLFSAFGKKTTEGAKELAGLVAKKMKTKKIDTVVFDRSGYKYHGAVASFVEELRSKGIKI